ncbi:MAG: c-type cytochrome, partial [bacterium]
MNKNNLIKQMLVVVILILPLLYLGLDLVGQEISLPENPMVGKQLFEQKGCISCHAVQKHGGKVGPDLCKNPFYGSFLQLAGIMWNHAPEMYKEAKQMGLDIPQFTENEMAELIAYLCYLHYLGQPGSEFRGKKLLEKKNCYKCHNIGGEGGDVGPDLSQLKQYVSPLYITQAMWNHGPKIEEQLKRMNLEFVEFKDDEIVDLTAAIKSLTQPTFVKSEYMLPGDPKKGEQLFETKSCNLCHAVRGKGGTLGPDFATVSLENSVTGIAGIMWNHGPKMWKLMREKGIPHPKFSGEEMADVIAFIYFIRFSDYSGNPEEGKKVFSDKGCINCHSIRGQGAKVGPDLSELKATISPVDMVQIMWNHAPHMIDKVT